MKPTSFLWIACILALTASALAQEKAPPRRANAASDSGVVDLGRIGPSRPSADDRAAPTSGPSNQKALTALKGRTKGTASPGQTWRVSPRVLYSPKIGVRLQCQDRGFTATTGNSNYHNCQGGTGNYWEFQFRQLEPNSMYLATLSANIGPGGVTIETTIDGQTTTVGVDPVPNPLFVVFETGAGQTTATVKFGGIRGHAFGPSEPSFHALELTEIN